MGIYTAILPQLTAPGLSDVINANGSNPKNHTFQVTVAAINTNVIVGVSGSLDNTSYGELSLSNTAVATFAITANRATITANGTYFITVQNTPLNYLKFNFISESGGTAATIDVKYMGASN